MKHIWLVALVVVGCKSKEKAQDKPAPGTAATADAAAPVTIDAAVAVAIDAPAPSPLVFNDKGLGPIEVAVTDDSDDGIKNQLVEALKAYPELAVEFEVMDTESGEEGYFQIKKGETEVAQIMRPSYTGEKDIEIHALDPMFATKGGIKPKDKASALAKLSELKCLAKKDNRLGYLTCTSPEEPNVTFVIDAENYKGKATTKGEPVAVDKIADREIFEIVR